MENRKLIILYFVIFLLVLNLALVLAVDPSFVYKKSDLIDLKVPCINNNSICSGLASCNITILYPNSTDMVKNAQMTNNGEYHNYTLTNSNTTGLYTATIFCSDNNLKGYSIFYFEINNKGDSNTPYGLSILMLLLPFILCAAFFLIAFNLDSDNKITFGDNGNPLLSINYSGYVKLLLYFLSYLCLWVTLYLAWQLSDVYLISTAATGWLRLIFIIMTVLIIPMFIGFFVIAIAKYLTDNKLQKQLTRGLKPR